MQEVGIHARIHVMELDVSSLQSVRKFVISFKSKNLPLNVLINNAGIMGCPFSLSQDGVELQFATNYLGHFLLTNLLLDKMKSTAEESKIEGRIVHVSSMVHKYTYDSGIRMHKINEAAGYSTHKAYGQSKLALMLHANELSRRLTQEKANVTINSVHPGAVATKIARHHTLLAVRLFPSTQITDTFATSLFSVFLKSIAQCFVALHPSLCKVTGKYFVDCKEAKPSSLAMDAELAENLWHFSAELALSKRSSKTLREQNQSTTSEET
ncbi:hypothetical protein KP509_33G016100 [Ceratopteris richardii]|uniref:Short-chain dehydrogenase TIC 32, chloroplastic n=1 Tax=Ceratopteris richardii TaxID=49495 RepID=A0A8T2QN03_CERRI|nr:hypothetical protein KP509_33G016100 [Ceratopteris richardii]